MPEQASPAPEPMAPHPLGGVAHGARPADRLQHQLVPTLFNPSYGVTVGARAAEWFRDHGMGGLVNAIETEWSGCIRPAWGAPRPPARSPVRPCPRRPCRPRCRRRRDSTRPRAAGCPGKACGIPRAAPSTACPAIYEATSARRRAHERRGRRGVDGHAAAPRAAVVRSDDSRRRSVAPTRRRFRRPLPGTLDAAFNPGFRMSDATAATTRTADRGAASTWRRVVRHRPGRRRAIGAWGARSAMSPEIASVRQNLDLIVDHGQTGPGLSPTTTRAVGIHAGGAIYVWRSGVGVTADGALVYVGGPDLDITVARRTARRAGAVRAHGARHQHRLGPVLDLPGSQGGAGQPQRRREPAPQHGRRPVAVLPVLVDPRLLHDVVRRRPTLGCSPHGRS